MSEPKKMTARRYNTLDPRCILCGKPVGVGHPYHTVKIKNRPLRHLHAGCWAEVKKVKP